MQTSNRSRLSVAVCTAGVMTALDHIYHPSAPAAAN